MKASLDILHCYSSQQPPLILLELKISSPPFSGHNLSWVGARFVALKTYLEDKMRMRWSIAAGKTNRSLRNKSWFSRSYGFLTKVDIATNSLFPSFLQLFFSLSLSRAMNSAGWQENRNFTKKLFLGGLTTDFCTNERTNISLSCSLQHKHEVGESEKKVPELLGHQKNVQFPFLGIYSPFRLNGSFFPYDCNENKLLFQFV